MYCKGCGVGGVVFVDGYVISFCLGILVGCVVWIICLCYFWWSVYGVEFVWGVIECFCVVIGLEW